MQSTALDDVDFRIINALVRNGRTPFASLGAEVGLSPHGAADRVRRLERAARQLYCHRHTLRYRIRRVEELTGRSLDSARDRIDFWLALRGRELVS